MPGKIYSQNEEQEIISKFINHHDITNTAVEIGINTGAKGDGTILQGNTVFLKEKGWKCLWIDAKTVGHGVIKKKVYPEDTHEILAAFGQIGIFSIDIDSEDWYVVQAMLENQHRPELLVCETNSYLDPMKDLVMPLKHRRNNIPKSVCHGATLFAFDNLISRFGYSYKCSTDMGTNSFWIRKDIDPHAVDINLYRHNRNPVKTNWSRPNHTDKWVSSQELLA